MINIALVHNKLGEFEKAQGILENVIKKVDPRDHTAYNNLANILYEHGKNEQAALYDL